MPKKLPRTRQPRKQLSRRILRAIEDRDYTLKVKLEISADIDDREVRRVGGPVNGRICFVPYDGDREIEIGSILGWQAKCFDPDLTLFWADGMGSYVFDSFTWLINCQDDYDLEVLCFGKPLLLQTVTIAPEWRGYGFALPAVATFLDLLDADFVFLQPHPIYKREDLPRPAVLNREIAALDRYWKRLGFHECGKKYKTRAYIAGHWECPGWLAGRY